MDYQLEDKQYDFLAKNFKKPTSFVYRIGINGKRYYYEIENGRPVIYASGTTLISDGYPEPFNALEQWRLKMRMEGKDPDAFAQYRANYGTIMHILFGDFLKGKKIPLNDLSSYIGKLKDTKVPPEDITYLIENNLEEFKKDLLAFVQFVKDYNVKPLAIELMLKSRKHMVATAVDLICEMDYTISGFFGEVYKSGARKGEPKETKKTIRVVGIVDFKSGKKGFYDKHALQLLLNKEIVKENYPELEIGGIFNFSPKEWRSAPAYNLKDQSENPVLNELEEVLSLGKKRHLKKKKEVNIYDGVLSINKDFDFSKMCTTMDLEDFIMNRKDTNNDFFELFIETHDIKKASNLRVVLNKMKMKELKEIASKIGITYTKKQDFIKELNKKYLDGKGKDTVQTKNA